MGQKLRWAERAGGSWHRFPVSVRQHIMVPSHTLIAGQGRGEWGRSQGERCLGWCNGQLASFHPAPALQFNTLHHPRTHMLSCTPPPHLIVLSLAPLMSRCLNGKGCIGLPSMPSPHTRDSANPATKAFAPQVSVSYPSIGDRSPT